MSIHYEAIGTIYTPFKEVTDMPVQPAGAEGVKGTVSVKSKYLTGLKGLDGFSHILLLYHFHQAGEPRLSVTPFLDNQAQGIFATRAPRRPNTIGLSVVKLNGIIGNLLQIENVDVLNGTPLLDIKPYVPEFDQAAGEKVGWLEQAKGLVKKVRSDDRFA